MIRVAEKGHIAKRLMLLGAAFCIVCEPLYAVNQTISAGGFHAVAINAGGTVKTWGSNVGSSLGNGFMGPSDVAVFTSGLSGMISVSAGQYHTLGLKSDGTVWAWGRNSEGQLGDGTIQNRAIPVKVSGLSGVVAVSAGQGHSLALKSDGTVWSWGANYYGELGDNTQTLKKAPVQVSGLTGVVAIDAGSSFSLALKSDGTVSSWGANQAGQLGNGATVNSLTPVSVVGLSGGVAVSAGSGHALALKSDGTVVSWGSNYMGRLGDGTEMDRSSPVAVAGISGVLAIAAGNDHSMVLMADHTVWSWGGNYAGQLGNETVPFSLTAMPVLGVADVDAIAAGRDFSFFLKSDGSLRGIGYNSDGQLGNGNPPKANASFRAVVGLSDVTDVAVGEFHSLALKSDGTVWSWGVNYSGALGYSGISRTSPQQIAGLSGIIAVSVGYGYSMALKSDGTVWTWGGNDNGQLGDSTNISRILPAQIAGLTGVAAISAGSAHSLARKYDGTVVAWGKNSNGQLGNGTLVNSSTPVVVSGLSNIVSISAANNHSLALKSDGTIQAWGMNQGGELGDETFTDRMTPVAVHGLSAIIKISAGPSFSLALKSDGTVYSWWDHYFLDPDSDYPLSPSEPTQAYPDGLNDVVDIGVGGGHAMVRKSDGSVWSWGTNESGQLGRGYFNAAFISYYGLEKLNDVFGISRFCLSNKNTVLVKDDGTVEVCGAGEKGILANGSSSIMCALVAVNGVNTLISTPNVEISSPSDGSIIALGSKVNLNTSGSVTPGSVAKVIYYLNGISVGEDVSAPFSHEYLPVTWGTADISAVAVSAAGAYSIPYHVFLKTPYDVDVDRLPDWREFKLVGSLNDGLADDSDADGIPNGYELDGVPASDPFDYLSNGGNTDGDGLPDGWELYYFGDKSHNGSASDDGDWLTDLEEYQYQTDPTFNDDVDLDGWLDRDESIIIHMDLTDVIERPSDLLPWMDQDGDGVPNAMEVSMGTDPLSALDPAVKTSGPLIKLTASQFDGSGTAAVWTNEGRAGGTFISESAKPVATSKNSQPAVEFMANQSDWMTGPRVSPWMNGSGSRTIVAWIYNTAVSATEDDVIFSWGGGSLGSSKPGLFSCRYGASATQGAIVQNGTPATLDLGWGSYPPVQGSWSFVVYQYNSKDGTLLAMRDFQAGFLKRNSFLQTGIFDAASRPYQFVLGGENKGDGTRDATLKTGLCLGELQVFDRVVPLDEIISNIYNPSRVAYGKTAALVDADLDDLPDVLEVSLGLNPAVQDSDQDGAPDGVEFKSGNDAGDFYNGMPHYVSITGGTNQWIWEGGEISTPIKFKITDVNGDAIPGAPADVSVVTVPTPNGKVRLTPAGSPLGTTLSTRSNASGEISIFFKAN